MCRYFDIRVHRPSGIKYRCTWVCTDCRNAKQSFHEDPQKCHTCQKQMHDVGLDLRVPRKTQLRKWRKLGELLKTGRDLHSCGCTGPGKINIG